MDDLPKLLGFALLVGFAGCLVIATVLAAISKAIWRTKFSWQVVLGISTAVAILTVLSAILWVAYWGSRTL